MKVTIPSHSVCIFSVLTLLVFAVSVMSGGCGSSSSSLSSQSVNDMLNGAWTYDGGTVMANVDGTRQELTVQNFTVLFESCDIEEESGSAVFTAIAPLKGEHFMLPMLFEKKAITTKRNDLDAWTADTEHGQFTVELLDNNRARLTGSVNWFRTDSISASVDVFISKLPSTAPTVDINTALNGEWQTKVTVSEDSSTINFVDGGGYSFHKGNIIPVSATFMNMTFSDTNIQAGTTKLTGVGLESVVYMSGETPKYDAAYFVLNEKIAKISHLFGDVYLISSPYPTADHLSLIAMLNDGKLSIISEAYIIYDGVVEENRGIFSLSKTTESNIASLDDFIGSSWESSMSVLDVYSDDMYTTLLDVDITSFDVSFPSADIENMKLKLSANAVLTIPEQIIPIKNRSAVLNVKNVGYNILFGETAGGNLFTVTLITDKLAIMTGNIGYTRDDWYDVDFLAFVKKVDEE